MARSRLFSRWLLVAFIMVIASTLALQPVFAISLPANFTETLVASGISNPTAFAFTPDGRLFVLQQNGQVRIITNPGTSPTLLAASALSLTVDPSGERGLLGIAFDPNFTTNRYVYLYYTVPGSPARNRISRFTETAALSNMLGSEVVLVNLDNLSGATNHNGGAMHFGTDGLLYVAVGENANASYAQSLANRHGKILRYDTTAYITNPANLIPSSNSMAITGLGTPTGDNRAIIMAGLRNPYTFDFHRTNGTMYINDVGAGTWEEINLGLTGRNFGWPTTEGEFTASSFPNFTNPLYAYPHNSGLPAPTGCAITGGTFYDPITNKFPAEYVNDYFFADYCSSWIYRYDTASDTVVSFATGLSTGAPVDLEVATNGDLYYLARNDGGRVRRISYSGATPSITQQPVNQSVSVGNMASFSCGASGATPLSFQWQRNNTNITGATSPTYAFTTVIADNNATYRCVVTNAFGNATSNNATLTVLENQPPVPTITSPINDDTYDGGQLFTFSGTATDSEDGSLPASAFSWKIDFHHDVHTHPKLLPTSGITSGDFTIDTEGHTDTNVWYRVTLTVTDSDGASQSTYVDIFPNIVQLTVTANIVGAAGTVDGQPVTFPHTFSSVVGIVRSIGVATPQTISTTIYTFSSWSDVGTSTHNITTPGTNTTYTATLTSAGTPLPTSTATATQTATRTLTRTNTLQPAQIIVSITSFNITEGGISVTYNVRLNRTPAVGEQVVITPTFNTSQLSYNPLQRTLDTSNYSAGRNFTVTAVNDTVFEPTTFITVTHRSTSNSPASAFNNLNGPSISVQVFDNDVAAIATATRTQTPTATRTNTATATRTNTPIATATRTQTPTATRTNTATATRTNTPIVTATHTQTATESSQCGGNGQPPCPVTSTPTATPTTTPTATRTNTQASLPSILINVSSITLSENGGTVTYIIRLSRAPAANEQVTIATQVTVNGQVVLSPTSRILGASNYSSGRTIIVSAVNDTLVEGVHSLAITHRSTSNQAGSQYNNLTGSMIPVTINDNDTAPMSTATATMTVTASSTATATPTATATSTAMATATRTTTATRTPTPLPACGGENLPPC